MTGMVVETDEQQQQVTPSREPSSVVRSLRMRFEKSGDSLEGAVLDKCPELKIASKAIDSIKKFESLAKEPGMKPGNLLGRSLSTNGSARVGSLRHKFESLANRSLSADLFNAPGESDEEQNLNQQQEISPGTLSESGSVSQLDHRGEAKVSPAEGEPDAHFNDTLATKVSQHMAQPVADLSTQGGAINEEMSTFSVESEDSIEEPALCLKEQIERARADELRSKDQADDLSSSVANPPVVDPAANEQNANVDHNPADEPVAEVKPPEEPTSYNVPSSQNPRASEGSNIESINAYTGNSSTVQMLESESRGQASTIAVSKVTNDAEISPEVKTNAVSETNNNLEDGASQSAPVEIARNQPRPKPRGFFQRLFTCGASV